MMWIILGKATARELKFRPRGHEVSIAEHHSQTKALMRETERIAGQINRESGLLRERLQSAEAREALAAFAERRQPDFSKLAGEQK